MPKSRSTTSDLSSFIEIARLKKQNAENAEFEERAMVKILKNFDIAEFRKFKDLAEWYRSLSNSQLAAAYSLTEAIRDDMDQSTSHRCRLVLWRLGVYPLESPKNIKFVINLSRGNDLAFLWFLMELFYLDTCAECDHPKTEYNVNQQILMAAIANLDMVTTLRELDKIIPTPPKPEPKMKRPQVVKPEKKTYLSPLLEPLPRPKIGENLKKRPPLRPVQRLRHTHLVEDPSYIPPNEGNRWYAWPEEKQKNLDFGFDDTQGTKVVGHFLRNHLYSILDESTDMKDIQKPLCATHLELYEKEKAKKRIEDVKKREETRKYFSPNERKRVRRKKITKQIEQDAKRIQDECDERFEYLELHTWIKCFIIDLIWNVTMPKKEEKGCALEKACSIEKIQQNQINKNQCHCCLTCVNDSYDFGHYGKPKPNEIYFHAPSKNKPYNFDYPKIFNDVEEKKDPIKNAISKALNLNEFANDVGAINSWLKSTWEEEVKKANEEYKQKEEVNKQPQIINPSEQEMDKILEDAFRILKKNPKFVFASMPNAHKHPSVRMWLRRKYGILKVTEKERAEAMKRSKKILYKVVTKQKYAIRPPTLDTIGKTREISYACRDYVYSKTKRALQKFYHEFKMLYLENVRTFWQLMEHRHCSSPPYLMFNAYMPSREYDIMPFRPWKTKEFRNAADSHRKRKFKKLREAKYKL